MRLAEVIVQAENATGGRLEVGEGKKMKPFQGMEGPTDGCQMVYFQAKNPNLGKFWRALDWKMLL
jgi:hypothetical protein